MPLGLVRWCDLSKIKAFLIDLAGVIHVDEKLIEGAKETLEFLKKKQYKYLFISNTTQKRRISISRRLKKLDIQINKEEIFTPPIAAINKLKKEGKNKCYLLSTGDIHEDFEENGIILTNKKVDYVIVGDAAHNFSFIKMNEAFRLLLEGADLIALEKDKYYLSSDGYMLSAGPFVAALEYATGKKSLIVGKPSKYFFQLGLNKLGKDLKLEEIAMIGDDINSDIGGAQQIGIKGILVKTGKFRKVSLENSKIKPDMILDSIADLPNIIL